MLVSLLAWLWVYLLFAIEAALVLLCTKLAFDFPELGSRRFTAFERKLSRFANRRAAAVLAVATLAFVLRGLLLPVEPVPEPTVHDEFSYLLQADTFRSGRLTNPTHPMWVHFESMHIEHQPSYASMYPPGQGVVLAAGQLFGSPFYGVWIMAAVMCGAICWMLQGWFNPGWAVFGASIAVIRLSTFSYWVDSYMLGALPATGGALILGAIPRILRTKRAASVFVLGIGIALLADARPYEGAALSAASVSVVFYKLIRQRTPGSILLWRIVAPLALVLVPTLAFMAYYDWRVFGSPLTLPYQVNRATYAVAGVYIWDSPRPVPVYRHAAMADFYLKRELPDFQKVRSVPGFINLCLSKLTRAWQFYLGPVLMLPILVLPVIFRDQRIRGLLFICGVFALALFVEAWFMPHYAAPITAAVLAIAVQALRHVRAWRWKGRPVGRALVRMTPLVCALMLAIRIGIAVFHLPVNLIWPLTWGTIEWHPLGRERIIAQLESHPGRHLVLVRYGPKHDSFREFVYNAADIDHARIVWARDMGAEKNRELLSYFKDRQVWELDADDQPPALSRLN
ncbi:MAG: hypothetical protein LAP38_07845 [Acidobacteriia bacterium]|nr:hypothetical protein [Terriglobia bacterium]